MPVPGTLGVQFGKKASGVCAVLAIANILTVASGSDGFGVIALITMALI